MKLLMILAALVRAMEKDNSDIQLCPTSKQTLEYSTASYNVIFLAESENV